MAAQSPFLLLRSRKSGPRVETKLLPPLSRGLGAVPPAGGLSPGAPGSCCSRPCLRATGGCRAAAPPEGPPATGARLGGTKGAEHSPQQRRRAALAAGARGPPPRVTWLGAEQRIKAALWSRNKGPPRARAEVGRGFGCRQGEARRGTASEGPGRGSEAGAGGEQGTRCGPAADQGAQCALCMRNTKEPRPSPKSKDTGCEEGLGKQGGRVAHLDVQPGCPGQKPCRATVPLLPDALLPG